MRYPLRALDLRVEPGSSGCWRWLAVLLLLACCWPSLGHAQVTVSAQLEPAAVAVGEEALLQLSLENGTADSQPVLPAVPGLRIAFGGTSQQVSIINFQRSARTVYSYRVVAAKAGTFTIPPITVQVGGRNYSSSPVTLAVQAAGGNGGDPNQPREVYLEVATPRTKVYVGEPFVLDISLFTMVSGQLIEDPQLPDTGFTLGKLVKQPVTRPMVGHQMYNQVKYKRLVTATRPGKIPLGPATMAFNAEKRNRHGFFDDPYRRVELASEPVELTVRPLPKNAPASFAGAIGSFTMRWSISPTNVAVGDPITVRGQISGRGTFDSLRFPEQSNWREFKVYPATSHSEAVDDLGISGTNNFEQVVVPQNAEIKTLPGFEFCFFDPEAGQYRVLKSPAFPITVRASAATPQPTLAGNPGAGGAEAPPANEIVHIKPDLGLVAPVAPPLVLRGWFWGLQAAFPLVWAGLTIWRRREEKLAANPRLQRRKQVDRLVREMMTELGRLAAAGDAAAFHAAAFRVLQERLGERLDLPAGAITEAVIDERRRDLGAESSLPQRLHEIFQVLNQARYAPASMATQLPGMLEKLKSTMDDLERIRT